MKYKTTSEFLILETKLITLVHVINFFQLSSLQDSPPHWATTKLYSWTWQQIRRIRSHCKYACPGSDPKWTLASDHQGKDTRSGQQVVADIAGKTVGRVPANICQVLSKGLREGWLKRAICIHTGGFIHRLGPQLKCTFDLHIDEMSPVSVALVLKYLSTYTDVDMGTVVTTSNADRPALLDYST